MSESAFNICKLQLMSWRVETRRMRKSKIFWTGVTIHIDFNLGDWDLIRHVLPFYLLMQELILLLSNIIFQHCRAGPFSNVFSVM